MMHLTAVQSDNSPTLGGNVPTLSPTPKLLKSYLQPLLVLWQHLMVVPLNQYNAEVKERETPWE